MLYELRLVTGLRRGEALGLRWDDVDIVGQCLFLVQQITEVRGESVVGTPKTKRGTRLVPLDEATTASFGPPPRRPRPRTGSPGCTLERSGPVGNTGNAGQPKVVSERLGHSQIAVTADLYTHVNRRVGSDAADRIARAVRPPAAAVPSAHLAQTPSNTTANEEDTHDKA